MPGNQKTNNYFPKISSIFGWLKNLKNKSSLLLKLIKIRCPFEIIKYQMKSIFFYLLVYPMTRVVLGNKRAENIYNYLLKFDSLKILPLPPPLKSKIILFSEPLIYYDIYFKDIYHRELIKNGMSIIDIGAHIGLYTVLAAEKVGNTGKIIAIEPEPQNYKQLLENIKLNSFRNVIPVNCGLGIRNSLEKLYINPYKTCSHTFVLEKNGNYFIEVRVKTLDSLREELNLKKVDIIKIDTEGAEIPVLKGAEKTLRANPSVKIIVAAEHYPGEAKEVCKFLNERGFKTKVSKENLVMTI